MKIATTLHLGPAELERLLMQALEAQFGVGNIKEISFDVNEATEGYGMAERQVLKFSGATVRVKMSIPDGQAIAQSTSSLASQITSVEQHCRGPYT